MRRFLVTAGLGFAALAWVGCTNGFSEEPVRVNRGGAGGQGGGSAGTGGGTPVAGYGGGGGAGGTGAETYNVPDAGPGDAGPAPDTFMYPSGCPVPNPIGIEGQKMAIQSFNFDTSELVLRNISTTPQTITGARLGWQWCSFPSYWFIAPADVVVPPGKTYKFILNLNTEGVWQLPQDGSELAVYIQSGTFDEPDKMVSFVSWGNGLSGGREYVADMALLWNFSDRVMVGPDDHGFITTGSVKAASGYTIAPARCLVAPPNP